MSLVAPQRVAPALKPETPPVLAPEPTSGPYTGASYLASLRDDREVYLNGERVDDVTSSPGLRNSARSIARLYDALHDPAQRDTLTCATDTGSSGLTHRFFRVARSREDLVGARDAIDAWSRLTFGWMGRSPDYKAALTTTFGAAPDFYAPFAENARRWYAKAQERVEFLSHAIVNPPVDRHKKPDELGDVCVRVVRETDAGIVVSGAKVVATGAAISHATFIGQTPASVGDDPAQALAFIVPVGTPGLKLICRSSFEHAAHVGASPFDAPLSSRFDENDAIITLDRVLVPWENVLIYRDAERCKGFFHATGFQSLFLFHGCTRLRVKLAHIAGLLSLALRATGGDAHAGNRALLGELIALSHTFSSLSDAMCQAPEISDSGAVLPSRRAAMAYSVLAPDCYPRVREIVQRTLGSALIYLPSSAADLMNPQIDATLRQYVRGAHGVDHVERIKVLKALWDAIGSAFAGRHELYERHYAGGWDAVRLMTHADAQRTGDQARFEQLAEQSLSAYDARGWTDPTWLDQRNCTDGDHA